MAERTARTHVSNILAKLGPDQPDPGRPVRRRARPSTRGRDRRRRRPASDRHRRRPAGAPAIVFVHGTRLTGAMWAAQQADARATSSGRSPLDLPGHGARADEPFTLDGRRRRRSRRRSATDAPAGGRSSSACRSAATSRWPSPRASRSSSAGSSCPARPPSRSASAMLPYLALAAVMDRVDGERLDRLNAWFFRPRYPPAIAEPIVAGGFWSTAGPTALRALAGERFLPRLAAYRARR